MREIAEFRLDEDDAKRYLRPDQGKRTGQSRFFVRVLEMSTDEPQYKQFGELSQRLRAKGDALFLSWDIRRRYTPAELDAAEMFHLKFTAIFEPAGEDCGTQYDDAYACAICGAGRKQTSELRLDLRKAPKTRDIARTIADDEWIVSQRLAELMINAGLTGFELHPVRHRARYGDDAIDLSKYPSGQELLRKAEALDLSPSSWVFSVWLNRAEQTELYFHAQLEHAEKMRKKETVARNPLPVWYQLVVTSSPLPLVEPTRCGIGPFDEDEKGECRCPLGHVAGLNLLSEVWVAGSEWDRSDVCITKEMVGTRRGVLVPAPLLLISPRFYNLLVREKIKGYRVDVAHLI